MDNAYTADFSFCSCQVNTIVSDSTTVAVLGIDHYYNKMEELRAEDLVYWVDDAIPRAVFEACSVRPPVVGLFQVLSRRYGRREPNHR